jgi:hypothetical protein
MITATTITTKNAHFNHKGIAKASSSFGCGLLAKACNNSLVFILVFVLFVLALVPNFRAEI